MISIIIPAYNVEPYIQSCLLSLLQQNSEDFEVILVNDGSTDLTLDVIEAVKPSLTYKFEVLTIKNSGVSVARNKGIERARGELIVFLDADDMLAPGTIRRLSDVMHTTQVDCLIYGYQEIAEDQNAPSPAVPLKEARCISGDQALRMFLFREINPGVGNIIVRKKVLEEFDISFAEGKRYSEDIHFIFTVLGRAKSVGLLDEPHYLYRVRSTSASSKIDIHRLDGYELIKSLENYFSEINPEFASLYKKYGTSRWVWATLWQAAAGSASYAEFLTFAQSANAHIELARLIDFPDRKVRYSSKLFNSSALLYYFAARVYASTGKRKYS